MLCLLNGREEVLFSIALKDAAAGISTDVVMCRRYGLHLTSDGVLHVCHLGHKFVLDRGTGELAEESEEVVPGGLTVHHKVDLGQVINQHTSTYLVTTNLLVKELGANPLPVLWFLVEDSFLAFRGEGW